MGVRVGRLLASSDGRMRGSAGAAVSRSALSHLSTMMAASSLGSRYVGSGFAA